MTGLKRDWCGREADHTEVERLSADDMATRREEEFLAGAINAQRVRAQGGEVVLRGYCCNCKAPCAVRALYCDEDCKADHEARLTVLARQGRRA